MRVWIKGHCRWVLEVVSKRPGQTTFEVHKWRWIVERTFGWFNRYRRLSKDYEQNPQSSETWIYIAMIHRMSRFIVADKQPHLQYLDMDAAIRHCAKGIGIWNWASNDAGAEPDVVMAGAGDVATMEALAATAILRQHFPDLKIRFINVVDLFRLKPSTEHPHGLSPRDFDSLFTTNKPIIFNFHGYPRLIHQLTYRHTNHANLHVRGYKEKGNINTTLELAIKNNTDCFSLAIDAIDRVPRLQAIGAHIKEWLKDQIIDHINYAHENGTDRPEIINWRWPGF